VQQGLPVEQAHQIAHEVEEKLLAGIDGLHDVVVHVEPERQTEAGEQDLDQRIRTIARRLPGTSVHSVQARNIGGRLYITLHLEVERSLSVEEGHALADKLEEMLRAGIPQTADVDVHLEPAGQRRERATAVRTDEPAYQEVRMALDRATREVEGLSDLHDVVISRVGGRLLVSAHWECDGALSVEEAHALSGRLERCAQAYLPALQQVIVHIEPRAK